MWGWPLPSFFDKWKPCGYGAFAASAYSGGNGHKPEVFISGFKGLIHGAPNMDTLVALGSAASFGYSVYALLP